MLRLVSHSAFPALVAVALASGCSQPSASSSPQGAGAAAPEEAVKEVVKSLQQALKAHDADKVWSLLDADSREDAERAAKAVREAYAKADAVAKAQQEKDMGLPGAELAGLTGIGFLKTSRFQGKYDELPDGKIEKVTVQGDAATVAYVEPDGDKEKLTLVRREGKWNVSLRMP